MKKISLAFVLLAISSCGSMDLDSANSDFATEGQGVVNTSSNTPINAVQAAWHECDTQEQTTANLSILDKNNCDGANYKFNSCKSNGSTIVYSYSSFSCKTPSGPA